MCIGGGVNTRSDSFTDFHSLKKIEYTSSFIGNGCTKMGYLFKELYDTIVSNLVKEFKGPLVVRKWHLLTSFSSMCAIPVMLCLFGSSIMAGFGFSAPSWVCPLVVV